MNERIYYSEDAKMRARREIGLLVLLTFGIGATIGSVLALLFAPKEGEEIREELAKGMEKRVHTVEKQLNELRDRVEDRVSDMRSN